MKVSRTLLALLAPIIVAAGWVIMILFAITGSQMLLTLIWPTLIMLVAMYIVGLVYWHRIEQTNYHERIEIMEMDVNSLVGRLEAIESQVRTQN